MPKLFENKQQILHIATEVIALIALTFYFSQKNKKMMSHIEDLSQRIEEQEELIKSHDNIIKTLVKAHQQSQQAQQAHQAQQSYAQNTNKIKPKKQNIKHAPKIVIATVSSPTKVTFTEPEILLDNTKIEEIIEDEEPIKITTSEDDEEENLDKELEEELEDLEEEDLEEN